MAAKARALVLSLAAFCLPAFANIPRTPLVAEKPHQGDADFALASNRGVAAANALNAPGLCECLYDSGKRSRSTGKERDGETGLDYFGARYFGSSQGRFTSPDAPFADQHPGDPQSWNLYSYGRNNPLLYVDPTGNYVCASSVTAEQCDSFQQSLDQAQAAANALKDKYGADSKQYKDAQASISSYGERGKDNGVT